MYIDQPRSREKKVEAKSKKKKNNNPDTLDMENVNLSLTTYITTDSYMQLDTMHILLYNALRNYHQR